MDFFYLKKCAILNLIQAMNPPAESFWQAERQDKQNHVQSSQKNRPTWGSNPRPLD